MKILFAPSEQKARGGEREFDLSSLLFAQSDSTRAPIIQRYNQIIDEADTPTLCELFGIKKESIVHDYCTRIQTQKSMRAIERYQGVAFEYLNYATLSSQAQTYIQEHTLLFSNLFGVLRAWDQIPEYKLKQGTSLGEITPHILYKKSLQPLLNHYLEEEEILDLRAGFYDKFYRPNHPYTTLKFLKNGKVVSHWAKAYRGIVLRHLALHQLPTIETLKASPIEGLILHDHEQRGLKETLIYTIIKE
jgi:cytoplasmic iron level regulating protein YaaA (DUF328/UPF0246 family)